MKRLLIALAFGLCAAPAFAQPATNFPSNVTRPVFVIPASAVNGGGTFPAQLFGPQSCTTPAYSFTSATTSGYGLASSTACVVIGGTQQVGITTSALTMASGLALNFGGTTASFARIAASGTQLRVGLADGSSFASLGALNLHLNGSGTINTSSDGVFRFLNDAAAAYGTVDTGSVRLSAVLAVSATAPTVTSAGTSPSITTNGTVTGRVNVGTGGTATTIVLAMPTAATGWNCYSNNITAAAANRANLQMVQQASTTTSATLQWQTVSTGAATAFTASDIVSYICFAY